MSKVLIVAVHPDDETLGCGGTILKHKSEGDEVYWLIITDISEAQGFNSVQVEKRQKEISRVAELYNFDEVFNLGLAPKNLEHLPMEDFVSRISAIFRNVKPSIVYIPNRSDIHTDHQVSFRALVSSLKNFRSPFIKRVLMYETISETEMAPPLPESYFAPNVFTDITDYFSLKLEIMKVYESEIMEPPLPRSMEKIDALARYRGSRISVKYSEAFMLLHEAV